MENIAHLGLYNRLVKVYKHRKKIAAKRGVSCFRVYDRDMPEHPVIVDLYADHAVLYEYKSKHKLTDQQYDQWLQDAKLCVSAALQIPLDKVHLKMRRRIIEREQQYQREASSDQFYTVDEAGLKFLTNYDDYLDTGLFIDHRITRSLVRDQSKGARVLNLFCYTGSFSIYASAGGAAEVWSLDLSNTYIEWGRRNDKLNDSGKHCAMKWIKCDVLQALADLPQNYFDIIVSDPPTFSNSKMMKNHWDVQAQHSDHLLQLRKLLTATGQIFFSNNATSFELNTDLHHYFKVKDITKQTTDFDFVDKLHRSCFLLSM
jgi:23S rRNA (cytosine1962-C5)-methyltransferase